MADGRAEGPYGAGSLKAFWRQGLAELRAAVYTDSNIAQPIDGGMYGRETPGGVDDDRKIDPDAQPSLLKRALDSATERFRAQPEREQPSERGREL